MNEDNPSLTQSLTKINPVRQYCKEYSIKLYNDHFPAHLPMCSITNVVSPPLCSCSSTKLWSFILNPHLFNSCLSCKLWSFIVIHNLKNTFLTEIKKKWAAAHAIKNEASQNELDCTDCSLLGLGLRNHQALGVAVQFWGLIS